MQSRSTPPEDPLSALAQALFRPMGVDGIYARTALYEDVVDALLGANTRLRDPRAEVKLFPPEMSRGQLEKSGYLKSFHNLLGCVSALHGTEGEIHGAVRRGSRRARTGPPR